MLCLPGFLSTGNSKTSTDAAEPIGETLAAKLEAEGLAALQNGEALSIFARPYCERVSYFQCHRSDGSSFHGRALVQKAVAKIGAALSANANSQRRLWMLSEAQLHAGNLTGALEHLLPFVRAARINEASKHHGEDPLAGLETFDTDPWGGTTGPGHVGWLPTALTDIHVFGTRGAHLAKVEPVQQEILHQHQYAARAFPAMHFVEIPGVTGRMAFTNSRRLHELAMRALPPPGDRPPAPQMGHLHHQLMLPSSGVKTLTIGLVCAKGFGDSHTTRALLGIFLARKRRPWRGPDGRRMTTSCYAPQPDDGSDIRRLWALRGCDAFVAAHEMSAPDLSRRIQRDRTHLLVDLHGYSLGHATVWAQVFQLRAAPVQAHFHGQPLTTGSPLIDWYVSDRVTSPPEFAQHYAEHLALLPSCYLCNSLAAMEHTRQLWAPSSAPAPALSRPTSQTVTRHAHGLAEQDLVMGYFGQTYKIDKAVLECWVAILKQVPRARLWLFFFPIQPVRTWEDAETNLVDAARAMGLRNASMRIVVSDIFPRDVEFETKRLADVYLDTHTFRCVYRIYSRRVMACALGMLSLTSTSMHTRSGIYVQNLL